MRRRLVLGTVFGFVLLIGITLVLRGRRVPWVPAFLRSSVHVERGDSGGSYPFRRVTGPNSYMLYGPEGVEWEDYVCLGSFDEAVSAASKELPRSDGWTDYVVSGSSGHQSVREMDRMFLRENRAVTIYRKSGVGGTHVRVWSRSPGLFSSLFGQ